jgi:hypothetical protein
LIYVKNSKKIDLHGFKLNYQENKIIFEKNILSVPVENTNIKKVPTLLNLDISRI